MYVSTTGLLVALIKTHYFVVLGMRLSLAMEGRISLDAAVNVIGHFYDADHLCGFKDQFVKWISVMIDIFHAKLDG